MSFDFGLSATSDSIQNWINNEFQHYANKKEREFERDMSEEEYSRAVEMWNATNVYNSPAEQRKRLEAAGLNPALMYGKSASPGIASPAPNWNAPKEGHFGRGMGFNIDSNGFQGILNAYNDLRMTNAEIEVKHANARYINNQADAAYYIARLWNPTMEDIKDALNNGVKGKYYDEIRRTYNEGVKLYNERLSQEAKTKMDQERWRMYDEEGLFLDQMSNAGRVLEREMGRNAAAIFDAIFPKVNFK